MSSYSIQFRVRTSKLCKILQAQVKESKWRFWGTFVSFVRKLLGKRKASPEMPRGVKVERPAPAESVEVSFNLSSLLLKLTLANRQFTGHSITPKKSSPWACRGISWRQAKIA